MKEQENFTIRFFARKSRGAKSSNSLLLVRVTVNSNRVEITLKKDFPTNLWDEKAQKCKGNTQLANVLNKSIETARRSLYSIEQRLVLENKRPTAEIVKARFNGLPDPDEIPNPTVLELYDEHNQRFKELVGTPKHSASTNQRHITSRDHLKRFIEQVYNKSDIPIDKVDFKFLLDYEHYFKVVRACNHNSTMKYIKNFGKVIRLAIGEGYISKNPFDKFKLTYHTVERVRLTQEEVDKMIALDIPEKRLDRVRDMFVFCIHAGTAYVDVCNLKMHHIYEDNDGTKWVKDKRKKTGVEYNVPLLKINRKIVKKYKDHPQRIDEGRVIPEISNQNYNGYLKELAIRCGIDKNLTSHIARHTFATTITLDNGVPLEVISKMLGHTDTKTTQIYAKMQEKAIKLGMSNLLNDKKDKKKKSKKKNNKGKKGGIQND